MVFHTLFLPVYRAIQTILNIVEVPDTHPLKTVRFQGIDLAEMRACESLAHGNLSDVIVDFTGADGGIYYFFFVMVYL